MADIRFNKGFPNLQLLHSSLAIHTSIVVAHGFSDRFPKSLALDENLNPNISYFVAILRLVAICALFGRQKWLWGVKNSVSWARSALLSWHIFHIILNFICKIANTRLTKICEPIFALAKRLPTSATLCPTPDILRLGIVGAVRW